MEYLDFIRLHFSTDLELVHGVRELFIAHNQASNYVPSSDIHIPFCHSRHAWPIWQEKGIILAPVRLSIARKIRAVISFVKSSNSTAPDLVSLVYPYQIWELRYGEAFEEPLFMSMR